MEKIEPVIDMTVIQEKANEYALKGAVETIKDFYSGYNSPYRKAIEESLTGRSLGFNFDLPDIVAAINDNLSKEVDSIANTAIAQTFIPLVQKFLTREEKEIKFSDILKEFVDEHSLNNYNDCSCEVLENERHGWLSVSIVGENKSYDLTLHKDYQSEKDGIKKYCFLSLPYRDGINNSYGSKSMKLSLNDGATLEMPFTRDVLSDRFTSYIARLIMSKSLITMDTDSFHEDMFPERCHCD